MVGPGFAEMSYNNEKRSKAKRALCQLKQAKSVSDYCHMLKIRLSFESKTAYSKEHTFQPNIYLYMQNSSNESLTFLKPNVITNFELKIS
ncbi:hypothetical protein VP01_2579g1 [Puccinia sorghi]|uniref:Uncharacterized protein n=1 Tax=Puccinia sorghi TaxID=27349 RepID=A0A0L6V4Z1_9BASI|nr:hypothetical protein VP01_2579g1 [Puccinia sorghi]